MSLKTLENAYILHMRPYRETSALLEVYTQDHGRLSLIARGCRGRHHRWRHILSVFQPLAITWAGRGDLFMLKEAENIGMPWQLKEKNTLFSGFYLNELLLYLLAKQDPHPDIFHIYHQTLQHLSQGYALEPVLRRFEKHFLAGLGYELSFIQDSESRAIQPDKYYYYQADKGFLLCDEKPIDYPSLIYQGQSLLSIHEDDYKLPETLRAAKRIFRLKLSVLLGNKSLKSRDMFKAS
jgi:DNA repair protein RecO (recombination protein O)